MDTNSKNKKDVFFFNTVNITTWMAKKIEDIIKKKGCTVISLKNESEILRKLDKRSVVNSVTVELKDANGKVHSLIGYNSLSDSNDCSKELSWLIESIKKAEEEAIREFETVSDTKQAEDNKNVEVKAVDLSNVVEKTKENVTIKARVNLAPERIIDILTKKEYMSIWMCGKGVFDGEDRKFSKITFENAEFRNFKVSEDSLTFGYKLKDFDEETQVSFEFMKVKDSTRIKLVHKGVPVSSVNVVKRYWFEKVFTPISYLFNCVITPE